MTQNQVHLYGEPYIEFGGTGLASTYEGQPCLNLTTNATNTTYKSSEFGFGLVYQTDGVDNSSYF
jgi:hypothetical protein